METSEIREFFDGLNHDYLAVHREKEDLFWAVHMATSDDHAGFARAERAFKAFVSDPGKLAAVRGQVSRLEALMAGGGFSGEEAELLAGLKGWLALFEANAIESPEGRAGMERIIDLEAALFAERKKVSLHHIGERGVEEGATIVRVGSVLF